MRAPRAAPLSEFGLVDAQSNLLRTAMFDAQPPDPAGKPWHWLPVVTVGDVAFDPTTQAKDGPVMSVNASQVTRTYTVRALTAAELSSSKDNQIAAVSSVLLQITFNHENRIRALEAKAAITVAQFKAVVKALL